MFIVAEYAALTLSLTLMFYIGMMYYFYGEADYNSNKMLQNRHPRRHLIWVFNDRDGYT